MRPMGCNRIYEPMYAYVLSGTTPFLRFMLTDADTALLHTPKSFNARCNPTYQNLCAGYLA